MRLLFTIDAQDYPPDAPRVVRPSVWGIILRGDKIALVHSLEYDFYKFPGGGIEPGEDHLQTLLREVAEESGLIVRPESVREYGWVRRVERGHAKGVEDVFEQDNYYYLCDTEGEPGAQALTASEQRLRLALEFADPRTAVAANRAALHNPRVKRDEAGHPNMLEREARVLELLVAEGYFENEVQPC